MRIGQTGKGSRPSDASSLRSLPGTQPAPPAGGPSSPPAPPTPSAGSELIGHLRSLPDIRPELLRDVEQRLTQGELLTRQAAEQTAAAILAELRGPVYAEP